jgi:hypothetical protein
MLYTGTDIPVAVPWSGLVSVTEAPTGGSNQAFYLDGRKILNIGSAENYKATIEALSAPLEFAPCAGRNHLSTGLFAGEQFKQSFAFSYRTLIGNDTEGIDFAYRIHVVYNATAQTANFSHNTTNDSSLPVVQSWDVTTCPVQIANNRPTSHIIFDTRVLSSGAITGIEAILYGDSTDNPRLPTSIDLIQLLAS